MKKARINFHYQYLGPPIGAIPYIHIDYVNDANETRDAFETLCERRLKSIIPHTGYYYGKDLDGNDFKVETREEIPERVQMPYYQKRSEFAPVEDYGRDSIETQIKESIIDVVQSLGDGLEISYCYEDEIGSIGSNYTTNLSAFNDEKMKNAVIHGVSLNIDTLRMDTMAAEDKIRLISMVMVRLFESMRKKRIGFATEEDSHALSVDFEVDGLNMDFVSNMTNYGEVIYNVALNHVKKFNKEVEMDFMMHDSKTQQSEDTITSHFAR